MKPCRLLGLVFVWALLIALFPQAVMAQDVTEPPPCDLEQLDLLRAAIDRSMEIMLTELGANQAQENVQVAMEQYEAYLAVCTPPVEQAVGVTLLAGTGEDPPVFKTKWGSYGSANGRFSNPYNATVDSAGNVYVADTYNHRIQKFTADGMHLATWGSYSWVPNTHNDPGKFAVPVDVAVDTLGNIYVSDSGNYRIQKLKPDGSFDKMWLMIPGSSWPYCLSVDSTGTYVYVAESFNHRIQQYTTNGVFVRAWGSLGSGDGQFNRPFGVDVDSAGNVYVTEALNNRIQKFDANGQFIRQWGSYGTGNGQFNLPFAVAADKSGNVFVAEALNNRIQKFAANGVFLTKWGSYGSGDGQFNPPYGVAVDSLGNIYVADTYNHRIQKFVEGTPPTANPTQDPPANSAGWNNSDVTVTWNWADNVGGSGIDPANCPLNSVAAGEGVINLTATCKDIAGNTGYALYTVQIDKTAPTISAAATTVPNGNGWYNSDVTVRFTCSDGLSGIPTGACPPDQILSAEGAVSSSALTVMDAAGNSSAQSNVVTAWIDKTAPTISAAATTAPNGKGWYNSDVTVRFTCSDGLSGIPTGVCPPDQILTAEGAVSSSALTVMDAAGNASAPSNVVTVKIDKTPPTLAPMVTPNPVVLNGAATVAPNAADALSGLAGVTCAALDTSTVGAKSVTCIAADYADNSASAAASYSVIYNFTGFFQPVDNPPVQNVARAGSAIPVKFSLSGNQGLNIFAAGYPIVQQIACDSGAPLAEIEQTVTAGGSNLSYDPAADRYTYVWKTDKAWANTCRLLTVKFVDDTEHWANFRLK